MAVDVDVAALASALVWPTVIVILLIAYRKRIGDFIKEVSSSSRVSKFTIGFSSLSIELAEAKRFEPAWTTIGGGDFRQTAISVGGSYVDELLNQLQKTTPADYFIVDLKNGNGWISSRLYLFTVLLQKVRGIRCIVFVDRYQDIRNHFLGIATPNKVQSALEHKYDWLENEFAKAYAERESWSATEWENLLNGFVGKIQKDEPPIPEKLGEWVLLEIPKKLRELRHLEKSKVWEHASWLDGDKMEEILKQDLQRPMVNERELQIKSDADKARLILSFEGSSFVAIVDEDRRFKKLIDRQPLVEEAIRGILK